VIFASDPVTDGKHVIFAMLVVGLVFLAVVGIGELTHWLGGRRRARRLQNRSY
jgi:hypothetical protein